MNNYNILIIYASDYDLGDLCKPGKETKARCQRAVKFIRKNRLTPTRIILSAGAPKNTMWPQLKTVMENYIRNLVEMDLYINVTDVEILTTEENPWGTFAETQAANRMIPKEVTKIFIISSWYHLLRIQLIWKLVSNRETKLIPVLKGTRWKNVSLELIKYFKLIVDLRQSKVTTA